MANCEYHWHSMEDKLTPGLKVKLFELLIMKIYSSQCSLLAEKVLCSIFIKSMNSSAALIHIWFNKAHVRRLLVQKPPVF